MRVSKWGNSLAVRLPTSVTEALNLKDGDEIEVRIVGPRVFEVSRDRTVQEALEGLRRIRQSAKPLPPGWKFDREELYAEREGRRESFIAERPPEQ